MSYNSLPQELKDKIFLLCDFEDLEKTRELQSVYVKKCTEFKYACNATNQLNKDWSHSKKYINMLSMLDFWCNRDIKLAVPMVALQYGNRQMRVALSRIEPESQPLRITL